MDTLVMLKLGFELSDVLEMPLETIRGYLDAYDKLDELAHPGSKKKSQVYKKSKKGKK